MMRRSPLPLFPLPYPTFPALLQRNMLHGLTGTRAAQSLAGRRISRGIVDVKESSLLHPPSRSIATGRRHQKLETSRKSNGILERKSWSRSRNINLVDNLPLLLANHRGRHHSLISYRSASTVTSSSSSSSSGPPASPLHAQEYERKAYKRQRRQYRLLHIIAALGAGSVLSYYYVPPVRRLGIAIRRIQLVAVAVLHCIYDYKVLFKTEWDDPQKRHLDYKACHSAFRRRLSDAEIRD